MPQLVNVGVPENKDRVIWGRDPSMSLNNATYSGQAKATFSGRFDRRSLSQPCASSTETGKLQLSVSLESPGLRCPDRAKRFGSCAPVEMSWEAKVKYGTRQNVEALNLNLTLVSSHINPGSEIPGNT